jgi:hypothetical protein
VQTTDKSIELILDIGNDARSCFVNLETSKFKRVISNLINNAAEAIETKEGIIRVVLTKELDSNLVLKIIDNGKGISEDTLLKIKQGKISSTKKEGCGLGISSSVQNIKSWGGSYDIQSKEREGTTFIIKLPITEAPDWFQNRLEIIPGMNVAVLDDDQSIHDVWETRFQEYIKDGQITLEHFYLPSEFVKYCEVLATPTCPAEAKSEGGSHAKAGQNLSSTKILFLIDYELLGCEETGLDLIEKLNLKNQSILVTSRYEEPAVKNKIIILGIKAIPKNFAPYILIEFSIF